jgi:hypothetical protein
MILRELLMIQTQIELTEEEAQELQNLAAARQLSVSDLIRQSIKPLFQSTAATDIMEKRKRAMTIAGRFHSGLSDLSTEHDKYLAEDLGE